MPSEPAPVCPFKPLHGFASRTHGFAARTVGFAPRTFGFTPRTFGFTLIELLVVISILALLISLLLPALGSAKVAAIKLQCQSKFRNIGIGFACYTNENDGYVVPAYLDPSPQPSDYNWRENHEFRACVTGTGDKSEASLGRWAMAVFCPADPRTGLEIYYARTMGINKEVGVYHEEYAHIGWAPVKRVHEFQRPSELIFMMDTNTFYFDWIWGVEEYITRPLGDLPGGFLGNMERLDRHPGGLNGLFVDTHVEFFDYDAPVKNPKMILPDSSPIVPIPWP